MMCDDVVFPGSYGVFSVQAGSRRRQLGSGEPELSHVSQYVLVQWNLQINVVSRSHTPETERGLVCLALNKVSILVRCLCFRMQEPFGGEVKVSSFQGVIRCNVVSLFSALFSKWK